jgi:hypothetical protein
MKPYNGYLIETFESSPRRWRVRMRRQDGLSIETFAGACESITTGIESLSVEDAITVAKGMVDVIIARRGQHAPTLH